MSRNENIYTNDKLIFLFYLDECETGFFIEKLHPIPISNIKLKQTDMAEMLQNHSISKDRELPYMKCKPLAPSTGEWPGPGTLERCR